MHKNLPALVYSATAVRSVGQPHTYNIGITETQKERSYMKTQEQQILNIVVNSIEAAGYSPYAQLTGYMATGNTAYITRQFGARKLVQSISPAVIRGYLTSHVKTA